MPLFARDFRSLMNDSLQDLSNDTNITKLSIGGKARAILEAVNRRVEEQFDVFDVNLARAFVSSAPGQFLELIGQLVGVTRETNVASSANQEAEIIKYHVESGTFGDINNGADIVVPQGEIISTLPNQTGVLFRTTSQVTLAANQNAVFLSAEAVIPGEDSNIGSNALVYHSFEDYADFSNDTLKITNVHPIANGKNFESDANFRFRIVNRVLESEAANETAIRLAALSTAGVADVIMIPRYRGIGTFGLIIKSVTPTVSDTLIDNVTANVTRIMSYGDVPFIRGPRETGLSMTIDVHYQRRASEDDLNVIEDALTDYVEGYINELDIGEEFVLNRFVADLFGVDDLIANFGEASRPIEELFVHKESRLQDNKLRSKLLGDYTPDNDERIIVEPSLANPIILTRNFTRR